MRMNWFIVSLLAGLAVCGVLVARHQRRVAPPVPAARPELAPVDDFQRTIRLDPVRGYTRDTDPLARLRLEEKRQRPQEGRN